MNNPFYIDKREVARVLGRSPQTIYNWQNLAIETLDDFAKAVIYQAKHHNGKFNAYQLWILRAISNFQSRTRNPRKNATKPAIVKFLSTNDFSLATFLETIPIIED
jgi:transposase